MSDSPCNNCEFKDEDKKNDRCGNCPERIKYAVETGMLPKEVLNKEEDPLIKEAREAVVAKKPVKEKKKKVCTGHLTGLCEPGCSRKVKARDFCESAYSKWKRKNPDKVRHYSRRASGEKLTYFDVRLQARKEADEEKYELLCQTAEIARDKYRTIQNQIFFWMKEAIEREGK